MVARSMIRHVVFFSAREPDRLDAIVEGLSILRGIPGVRHLEVGRNLKVDAFDTGVDIMVYAEFDDLAALDAYKAHPTYAESIRRVRPLREMRLAADVIAD